MARFFAFSFCFLMILSAGAQEKWTLEKCITHALENNLQIRQTQLNEEAAKNQLTRAYADFLPSVNAELTYGVNFGRSIDPTTYEFVDQRIQTSSVSGGSALTLFSGLNKLYTLKQSKYDVESARYATEDIANIVSLNITSFFLTILLNTEIQKTAEERLKLGNEQVEQTKKLVNAGALPEGNLLDVLAQQATDSFTYIVAKNAVELTKLNLAIALQLEDPAAFDVEIPQLEVSAPVILRENTAEYIYNTALNNQASVKSANYSVLSAEKSLSAVRGLYYPNLQFFYNLRTNYSSVGVQFIPGVGLEDASFWEQYEDNFNQTVGFRLAIPILNGWQTRTTVKNMELQVLRSRYALKVVQDQLKNEVYVAYADARAAYQRFLAAENGVSALQRSFEYVTKKFNLGAATTLEYSTSSNNLLSVESEMIQAKYDYIFKLKVLDFYLGNRITLN